MNIDPNTVLFAAVSIVAFTFAVAYFRLKLREKFNFIMQRQDDQMTEIYREQEKLWQRVMACEKCCQKNERCDKNFYNTTA